VRIPTLIPATAQIHLYRFIMKKTKFEGGHICLTTAKKPRIAEVDIRVNRDDVDEPLSDDESLGGKIVQK
jgi:hypothetical protein